MNDKTSETRVEHCNMASEEGAHDTVSTNLKITRDGYLENKKGIFVCLIISMALFEFGLDQGMVNGL